MELLSTRRGERLRLLALIPHRDVRRNIRAWSGELFATGMAGAWAFPWAVPLAILSRPLDPGELRDAAFALREANQGGDGKIRSLGAGLIPLGASFFPENPGGGNYPAIYGLRLDLVVPDLAGSAAGALVRRLEPAVLGAALIEGPEEAAGGPEEAAPPEKFPPPPETAFRAAALVNMSYRARAAGEGAMLFEWKTGKPRWLPSVKTKRSGAPS
jgi:hypothetical protein